MSTNDFQYVEIYICFKIVWIFLRLLWVIRWARIPEEWFFGPWSWPAILEIIKSEELDGFWNGKPKSYLEWLRFLISDDPRPWWSQIQDDTRWSQRRWSQKIPDEMMSEDFRPTWSQILQMLFGVSRLSYLIMIRKILCFQQMCGFRIFPFPNRKLHESYFSCRARRVWWCFSFIRTKAPWNQSHLKDSSHGLIQQIRKMEQIRIPELSI